MTTPKLAQEMDYGPHTKQGQQSDSHRGPSTARGVVPRGKPKSKSGGVFEETAAHIIQANLTQDQPNRTKQSVVQPRHAKSRPEHPNLTHPLAAEGRRSLEVIASSSNSGQLPTMEVESTSEVGNPRALLTL